MKKININQKLPHCYITNVNHDKITEDW